MCRVERPAKLYPKLSLSFSLSRFFISLPYRSFACLLAPLYCTPNTVPTLGLFMESL